MDSLICITCSLENNAFSVLHYVMVALHYSMLDRFEIFSAPGTIALGSIRLPPREAARWRLIHMQTNINKPSCCFCKRLRLLYSFLRTVSDSYLSCNQECKMMMKNYRVSQKFVPLNSGTITFDQNFFFYMKLLEDVYFSIEYMYSEFQ